MARRLKALAQHINENLEGYEAKIVVGYHIPVKKQGKSRFVGEKRTGKHLKVRRLSDGATVFSFNNAEPCQSNAAVEFWIERVEAGWVPHTLRTRY